MFTIESQAGRIRPHNFELFVLRIDTGAFHDVEGPMTAAALNERLVRQHGYKLTAKQLARLLSGHTLQGRGHDADLRLQIVPYDGDPWHRQLDGPLP